MSSYFLIGSIIVVTGILYTFFSDQIIGMCKSKKNIQTEADVATGDVATTDIATTDVATTDVATTGVAIDAAAKCDPQITEPVEQVIVTFKGSKYDVTKFLRKHPGGKAILLQNNGNDVEQQMLENEHSAHAYKTLEKYKIN